jgi:hypothetical protein
MKAFAVGLIVALAALFLGLAAQAQYKGPRDYFPKNNPVPGVTNPAAKPPNNPTPGTPQAPATPQQPKFKDLAVNSQFYFLSDTNRTYAWTKTSATTAKNTKNGATATLNGETPIQR